MKEIAEHLLQRESASSENVRRGDETAAFRFCGKLRKSLSKPIGAGGVQVMFSRALALAGREVGWLRDLEMKADGTLANLAELRTTLSSEDVFSGEVALLAALLGLLVTFIGPALTLQLLQDNWPDEDFSQFEF